MPAFLAAERSVIQEYVPGITFLDDDDGRTALAKLATLTYDALARRSDVWQTLGLTPSAFFADHSGMRAARAAAEAAQRRSDARADVVTWTGVHSAANRRADWYIVTWHGIGDTGLRRVEIAQRGSERPGLRDVHETIVQLCAAQNRRVETAALTPLSEAEVTELRTYERGIVQAVAEFNALAGGPASWVVPPPQL